MTAAALVSIITPCHNAAPFIAAAIDSARAQQMTDWEMLVVDDGSTDASNAIVADYAARDRRITLITLAQNVGVTNARNTAIRRASGRYIAFLDGDDLWLPDKLARQIAFMTAHDLAFSYASYRLLGNRGRHLGAFIAPPSITHTGLLKTCAVGCLTAIYDTRKLGKIYLPDAGRGDFALWLRILKRIKTTRGITEPLAVYRVGKTSYSSNKFRAARRQWQTYTQCEQLGNARSLYYLSHYVCRGIAKYVRSRLNLGAHSYPPPPPPKFRPGSKQARPDSGCAAGARTGMTVKKILVLTSRLPYPVVGGDRLRIYAICRELSKRYEVTLLSLCESRAELEMALPADGVFAAVERVLLPKWRSRLNCLRALPGAKPLQVAYYESDAFKAKLAAMLQTHDLVFAHLIRTAHYLHDCAARKALDMTDAISLNYARVFALAKASGIKNIIYDIERTRVLDYERAVVKRFDFSLLASQVDKDFLFPPDKPDASGGAKVLLCTNGVDFQRIRFSYQPDGKTLVFIGNMTSLQNLDAARWFCRRVMPLLMKECGGWRLKIIGRIKQRDQAQFNRHPNVTATGYVADIHEEARGAFAGVCPVRLAAGIQNKILDYMAMGLPCIASTTGAEGLTARPNKEFLLANTPQEYTNQIKTLTQNPTTAQTLTTNARHYVETQHAWSSTLAPLLDAVAELGNPVILER